PKLRPDNCAVRTVLAAGPSIADGEDDRVDLPDPLLVPRPVGRVRHVYVGGPAEPGHRETVEAAAQLPLDRVQDRRRGELVVVEQADPPALQTGGAGGDPSQRDRVHLGPGAHDFVGCGHRSQVLPYDGDASVDPTTSEW